MKPIQHTKRVIIIALLLSLLFHTSSILYVVLQKIYQPRTDLLQEKDEDLKQKLKKQEEWAETKARAGNFGAPVLFQDIPEETPQENSHSTEKIETSEKIEEESDLDPIEKEQQKIMERPFPEKTLIPEKNASRDEQLKQKVIPPLAPSLAKKTAQPVSNPFQQKKPIAAPKPPLSLAQLTQGFLNHVKDDGKHAIHMLGKKNGTPADEQIKYERYLQKLSWCLQNSFNINNYRVPVSAITESTVYILLALNKDGTMRHCNVTQTSGDAQVDKFTLFIFNDASASFPPVPHYLPHDPFTITYIITHNSREQNGMRLYRR